MEIIIIAYCVLAVVSVLTFLAWLEVNSRRSTKIWDRVFPRHKINYMRNLANQIEDEEIRTRTLEQIDEHARELGVKE